MASRHVPSRSSSGGPLRNKRCCRRARTTHKYGVSWRQGLHAVGIARFASQIHSLQLSFIASLMETHSRRHHLGMHPMSMKFMPSQLLMQVEFRWHNYMQLLLTQAS
jgi:hypothetical protein